MLNMFQHLIGLWQGALSQKDPEPVQGDVEERQGAVSRKDPETSSG